jgi:hypothetical protein
MRAQGFSALVCVAVLGGVANADDGSSTGSGGVAEHARVELVPPANAFKQLVIENPLGDVRVEGYDGNAMMIETHKHAPTGDALDRLRVSLVPNPDGTVRIMTTADNDRESGNVSRGAVRIDLVIRAPRKTRVEATVSSGKLEVVNMDGGGELDTASGPISVVNVQGGLETHSISGATSLTQVWGTVDAQTLSSDVDLDTIHGERLTASADKGRIAGRRVLSRDIELTTTDGRISLEAEATIRGHVIVASLRGEVDVRLHRRAMTMVRARGVKVDLGGTERVPGPDGWVAQSFGTGDHPALVELRSRWGNVRLAIVE